MRLRFLFAACAAAFLATELTADPVVDLKGKGRKLIFHTDVEFDRKERQRVKKFQKEATFYGAIAVDLPSRGKDGVGATWGYNSLEIAQQHALKYCRSKTTQPGANCVLLLSVVPATKSKGSFKETLSRKSLDGFAGMLERMEKRPKEYAAFAASNFYNWGWAIRETKKQAQTDALNICIGGTKKAAARKKEDWARVKIDPKTNKCRVLQTFSPSK